MVFVSLVEVTHVWETCRGPGVHYIVTTAGLLAVFVVSFVAEVLLTTIGCRGAQALQIARYQKILFWRCISEIPAYLASDLSI